MQISGENVCQLRQVSGAKIQMMPLWPRTCKRGAFNAGQIGNLYQLKVKREERISCPFFCISCHGRAKSNKWILQTLLQSMK